MSHNIKLKRAVGAALVMIATAMHAPAHALGLGDLQVKSQLGQPFRASLMVYGAAEIKDPRCIKLGEGTGDVAQLVNASLQLGPLSGDDAVLTIRSKYVVNEPILNISIAAQCVTTSVSRDYVALLDPVLSVEPSDVADELSTNDASGDVKNSDLINAEAIIARLGARNQNLASTGKPDESDTKTDALPPFRVRMSANKSARNTNKQTSYKTKPAGDTGVSITSTTPSGSFTQTSQAKTYVSRPRLSISSGSASGSLANQQALLRMDTKLGVTPDPNARPILSEEEALNDDITAMTHRLANLERQLNSLQQENGSLRLTNQQQATQIAESQSWSAKLGDFLPWLGGFMLLGLGAYGFSMWSRRQLDAQTSHIGKRLPPSIDDNRQSEHLTTEETLDQMDDEYQAQIAKLKSAHIEENHLMTEAPTGDDASILLHDDDANTSVLDHADVFLAHGRTSMAIQLLQNHLLDHPKQSITIWLFLLDLLSKENMPTEYANTVLECKQHFNIKIVDFSKSDDTSFDHLEAFPRLSQGLQDVWDTPECLTYLDDLIYNNRLEPRAGFDKGLINELLLLKSVAQERSNLAEVIQLDEKKQALKEQKEAQIAAMKADKLQQLQESYLEAEQQAQEQKKKEETFEFSLIEWK